jgi:hypothetical protein
LLHAKKALTTYASPASQIRKYQGDGLGEADSRPWKLQKQGSGSSSSSSSFRGDLPPPREDNSSFRNGSNRDTTRNIPACIACEGNHRLQNHPPSTTTFGDGSSCFTAMRDGELWTIKPFQGPNPKRVCVAFNLPQGCHRPHDVPAQHICSLCGKEHGAVPRNSSCSRRS